MKLFLLVSIGLTIALVDSASESRIWYEGEQISGKNSTVPRQRDPSATGTIIEKNRDATSHPTTRFSDTAYENNNQQGGRPDYSSMTINRPISNGGSSGSPDYSSMTINRPIGNGGSVSSQGNPSSTKPDYSSMTINRPVGISNSRNPGDNQGSAGYTNGNSVGWNNAGSSSGNQWSSNKQYTTSTERWTTSTPRWTTSTPRWTTSTERWTTSTPRWTTTTTTQRPYYSTRAPARYNASSSGGRYPSYSSSSKTTLFGMPLDRVLSRGIAKLTLDLERVISKPGNLVFSPTSISAALALLLLGSAGRTKDELYGMLGVHSSLEASTRSELHLELGNIFRRMESSNAQEFGPQFSFACGVFVQDGFPPTNKFVFVAQSVYRAQVVPLNFRYNPEEARSTINKWVSEKTFGRINNIISDSISPDTKAIVANALYFNGQWEHPFHIQSTRNKPFYVSETETVDVPTMLNAAEVYYHENKKRSYKTLGLPYKGGDVAMFMVLPEGDLRTFVRSLVATDFEEFVNETSIQQVIFTVPRMKLVSALNLRRPLQDLGARSLFNPRESDLSNLAQGVVLSDAIHKVEIEVTETGTVAAATTAFTLTRDGTTPVFRADRPFLFFLYHLPTRVITFWGTVNKPTPNYPHSATQYQN